MSCLILSLLLRLCILSSFFLNLASTTDIYTLSLHDALPISAAQSGRGLPALPALVPYERPRRDAGDRKSTRLNSSHLGISYAVFCLKKKKDLVNQKTKNQWYGAYTTGATATDIYNIVNVSGS